MVTRWYLANILNENGLQVNTQQEWVTYFTSAFEQIYGSDINLDPSSPDAEMMMIYIQAILDVSELLVQVYSSMDPDNAIGVTLDQRCALNGIQRQAGTYTTTFISVVTDRALNLPGADQTAQTPYTASDESGNNWILVSSIALPYDGVYSLLFRAENPGEVFTIPNTITIQTTIILGVLSVNNPTTYQILGINEESDADLKIRRQQSTALSSQGYLAGLYAALLNIPQVSFAKVYENVTGSTDASGIPGHSIWVIVAGTAEDSEIANAIYRKRNAGCGMKGDQTYAVTQPDGSSFVIRWDEVEQEALFIKFTATSLDGVNPPDLASIRSELPATFVPGVNEQVNINDLATAVQQIDNNTLVTVAGFSTSSSNITLSTLSPTAKNLQFAVTSANIIIYPIILNPVSPVVSHNGSTTLSSLGGYGAYTYSYIANNSGGSLGSVNGVYVAGSSNPVTDIVKVTDALGSSTIVSVSVT